MKVLFTSSEITPWVKTGGLADVTAGIPDALRAIGIDARILVPAYPALKAAFPNAPMVAAFNAPHGQLYGGAIREARTAQGAPIYLLECDAWFDRSGSPYFGPEGRDWLDNPLRFGQLSAVAALLASGSSPLEWRPDILHCNDWQTGLAPSFLHYYHAWGPRAATVMTIHNLAFQGQFGRDLMPALGLPDYAWGMDGVEYYGCISFLKGGLQHADAITTVSPTYAKEIQTPVEGMGMDGLLRYRADRITGIINGIDTTQWNPAADSQLIAPYDANRLARKAVNSAELRVEMGLEQTTEMPLFGIISRLTDQKGLDLVAQIAAELAALPVQLAVLGSGRRDLEAAFLDMAHRWPGQFAVRIGFDEGLAHRIEAGADFFLMPSRFEPCGLNQMYSLCYGTLPIVRATGGLADTVIDAADEELGNGFVFDEATPTALLAAVKRAVSLWQHRSRFKAMQRRAMSADFSWTGPAEAYAKLYRSLRPDAAASEVRTERH
ncbi:MAG TPA: glycogen synthase GlgA [Rhodocyclaceae bacterium]|nr:glycogen synthase GlgA [Rhodocyclaceae bacterium]